MIVHWPVQNRLLLIFQSRGLQQPGEPSHFIAGSDVIPQAQRLRFKLALAPRSVVSRGRYSGPRRNPGPAGWAKPPVIFLHFASLVRCLALTWHVSCASAAGKGLSFSAGQISPVIRYTTPPWQGVEMGT